MFRSVSAFICLAASLIVNSAHAEGVAVEYTDETGTVLEGYHFPSECKETKGTALITHQWMGITDYEQSRASMVSKACYDVFVVDVYGKNVRPTTTEVAGKEATKYKSDPALGRTRMKAGLAEALKLSPSKEKPIILGYCFGGTMALELARSGADIATVIPFHSGLATKQPAEKGRFKAAVIAHHGAADPLVTAEEVAGFKKEMADADVKLTFYSYPNAVHAFTQRDAGNDPSKGFAYNEKADQLSWKRTLDFLAQTK